MEIKTINRTIEEIKEIDERSAVNGTMLKTMAEKKIISSYHRGNRTVFEMGEFVMDMNRLFGFGERDTLPRVRSIHDAFTELRVSNTELGISEERIRFLVKKEKIPSVRIGKRAYVALETFEPPFDHCLIYDDYMDSREAELERVAKETVERAKRKGKIRI